MSFVAVIPARGGSKRILHKTVKQFYSKDAIHVILPRYLVQDIDILEDWETAEKMYAVLQMDKIN
jgi:pseudaminic acid cytidylyltransferase